MTPLHPESQLARRTANNSATLYSVRRAGCKLCPLANRSATQPEDLLARRWGRNPLEPNESASRWELIGKLQPGESSSLWLLGTRDPGYSPVSVGLATCFGLPAAIG